MAATSVAILARAPVPGFAKTRLVPAIGAHAAAVLQERLTAQAVAAALAAKVGPVTLWCTPDLTHRSFRDLGVALKRQPEGDLGARMLACFEGKPTLVIGADCPCLTPAHLRDAAQALVAHDVVLIPAEDGGYVLVGAKAAHPGLFEAMTWSVPAVLAETRKRIAALGLSAAELPALWDVDTEDDLARMEREFPELAL
ncbi:MAG TPA: TIGR04282 family arsenosugar biosynthesis glycosyltransferase [Pseudolabrys sp.]|nr:TIGR04282 family arsenosugar biosynthesis glycosyltransferase [Pseudolabrys sp.]